ncbi:MAG TPA: caspase family protein, partial [Bacteroidota bacterium]
VEAIFKTIARDAKPQDAFVFYYAGHGVMSEGSASVPSDFFLVPTDVTQLYGDDAMLASKAISAAQLKTFCTAIRAQKQLVVLDACQSGGAIESFATRGASEERAIMQLARSAGTVVLASTSTEQFATEFSSLAHGVFTYALLQGLNGEADGGNPRDGKITVKELEAYLNDRVPELTKKYRGTAQYPNSYARGQDFPLGVK